MALAPTLNCGLDNSACGAAANFAAKSQVLMRSAAILSRNLQRIADTRGPIGDSRFRSRLVLCRDQAAAIAEGRARFQYQPSNPTKAITDAKSGRLDGKGVTAGDGEPDPFEITAWPQLSEV